MSGKPNQDNLDDIYSDLSDDDKDDNQNQKQKQKDLDPAKKKNIANNNKPKPPQNQQPGVIIKMPSFLGGKAFIPPPPPPSSRPVNQIPIPIPGQIFNGFKNPQQNPMPPNTQHTQPHVNNNQNNFNQGQHNQLLRERKSTIYIKNIPKLYNRQQTLTTFFRTYGNIKSIKTNQQKHSAVVRFQKQQQAYRFMQTHPVILNRSFIRYDNNDEFVVPAQCIAQRQKDQLNVVNQTQKQFQIQKENSESIIADKYRALLFLNKFVSTFTGNKYYYNLVEQQKHELGRQMEKCRRLKQAENNSIQLSQMLTNFQNDYDWTLAYKVVTKQQIQKKKVIAQFHKYGPIGTITIKLTSLNNAGAQQVIDGTIGGNQDKLAIVKLKFLGVRSSWQMYIDHCEDLNLQVQGCKLKNVYKSWFVKNKQELKMKASQEQQKNPKELQLSDNLKAPSSENKQEIENKLLPSNEQIKDLNGQNAQSINHVQNTANDQQKNLDPSQPSLFPVNTVGEVEMPVSIYSDLNNPLDKYPQKKENSRGDSNEQKEREQIKESKVEETVQDNSGSK